MSATDLTRASAAELASLISSGATSSAEVTRAHLDRIAAVDGEYNAFLHVANERALAAAHRSTVPAPTVPSRPARWPGCRWR